MGEKARHIPRAIVDRFLPGILAKQDSDTKPEIVQDVVAQDEVPSIDILPAEGCKHHWKIPTPDGPTSKGACKNCGGEKNFKNYEPRTPRVYRNPPVVVDSGRFANTHNPSKANSNGSGEDLPLD